MEQNVNHVCRLCLKKSQEIDIIDESHYEIVTVLLPSVDLAISHEPVVCKTCTNKLQKSFTFKTASVDVEEHLEFNNAGVNECLFCRKSMSFDSFVSLYAKQLDMVLLKAMIEQFFPELDIRGRVNPIVCLMCYDVLQESFDFLLCCLNTEEQIKKYCEKNGTNNKGQIELQNIVRFTAEKLTDISSVKIEERLCRSRKEIYNKTNIICYNVINKDKENETVLAPEFVKVERSDEYCDIINQGTVDNFMPPRSSLPSPKCIKEEINTNIINEEIKIEETCLQEETPFNKVVDTVNESIDAVVKRWQNYKQELTSESKESDKVLDDCADRYNPINKVVDTMNESIDAVVKRWQNYKQELTSESKESDKVLDDCADRYNPFNKVVDTVNKSIDAVVKRWQNYKQELTSESKESDKVLDDCADSIKKSEKKETMCKKEWWTTIARSSKKDRIQNEEYFSKSDLRNMITILRIAGEKKYQCQVCLFVARAKCSMNRHMMLHQNPSELTFYHCHHCGFKSKRKGDLVHHIASHRDRSQEPLYQCQHCPFQTRLKSTIKYHMLKHGDSPEVPMFECHTCGFKTGNKGCITLHVNNHRKPKLEPKVHSCDKCSYQTYKRSKLKCHFIIHMHPSELLMHRCDYCEYETKHRSALIRHKDSHRDPVECRHCDFNSRFPKVLRKHYQRAHNIKWVDDKP